MKRVAERLGFTTMSLYRYVTSKDELLLLMQDSVWRPPDGLELPRGGWRADLAWWTREQYVIMERHPWLDEVRFIERAGTPSQIAWMDLGLRALERRPPDRVSEGRRPAAAQRLRLHAGAAGRDRPGGREARALRARRGDRGVRGAAADGRRRRALPGAAARRRGRGVRSGAGRPVRAARLRSRPHARRHRAADRAPDAGLTSSRRVRRPLPRAPRPVRRRVPRGSPCRARRRPRRSPAAGARRGCPTHSR